MVPDRSAPPSPRRRVRAAAVVFLTLALLGLAAGCGTSGRELRDPVPGATAPPRRPDSTTSTRPPVTLDASGGNATPASLTLSSSAWAPGGAIPTEFTCAGADVSPPLVINAVPAGTAALLLVVISPDDVSNRRWIVAGLAPETTLIPRATVPTAAIEVVNSSGGPQWSGPCPQTGTVTYAFTILALPTRSGLTAGSSSEQVTAAMRTASATATLTGTASVTR